jgi:hypothetical protein
MNALLKNYVNTQANMRLIQYDLHDIVKKIYKWPKTAFTRVKKFISYGLKK